MKRINVFRFYRGYVVNCSAIRRNSESFMATAQISRFRGNIPVIVKHSPHNVLFPESIQAINYMLRLAEGLIDDLVENRISVEKLTSAGRRS